MERHTISSEIVGTRALAQISALSARIDDDGPAQTGDPERLAEPDAGGFSFRIDPVSGGLQVETRKQGTGSRFAPS